MEILLEEFYRTDLHIDKFHDRKVHLDNQSYQINGISQSGKTKLIKNYLLSLKKSSIFVAEMKTINTNTNWWSLDE